MIVEKNVRNYSRKVLLSSNQLELVSIEWNKDGISPPHNHGWSQCLVLIEEGVFENTLNMGMKREVQILEKGQVLNTLVGSNHFLQCVSSTGKTFHLYLPKIQELPDSGRFTVRSLDKLKEDIRLNHPTRIESLREIVSAIREHSISTVSPFFMNQLFSGILPQMLLAEELISQTKTTLATFEASPAFSTIEMEVVQKMGELIGWKKGESEGLSVPGGSAANFMAVHCARQRLVPEIKKQGMGGHRFKIYVSSEAHYSFKKACVVLGLGTDSMVSVPVDPNGRMLVAAFEALVAEDRSKGFIPLLAAATAGTTVLGAFDPIEELSLICRAQNIWLHVDGAWGGPALFSRQIKKLMKGVERADSMTFDAHKLFGASLSSSFFLTPHRGLLLEANDVSGGDYLFHSDDLALDRGKLSWQCGRRAEATSFWAIWKSMGTEGLGEFVDKLLQIRDLTLIWIKSQPRLELIVPPDYLNICVRVISPQSTHSTSDWSRTVREKLKENNFAMVNYSSNEKGTFLRLILAHPYLEFEHVKQVLEWALEIGPEF